jgi:signal transduction histidine kinase
MEERMVPEIEAGVYRIVQEALTNVVRHAGISACRVRLVHANGLLTVTIADQGVGFQIDAPSRDRTEQGLGLIGIRERVWHLEGTVVLDSAPGRGTTLECVLPARLRTRGSAQHDEADTDSASVRLPQSVEVNL